MQVSEKTILLNTQVVYVCRNYELAHSKCYSLNKVHAYLMLNHNGPKWTLLRAANALQIEKKTQNGK